MAIEIKAYDRVYRTRFKELGFAKIGKDWRMLDLGEDGTAEPSPIGPYYQTRAELLGDLTLFASEFGAEENDMAGEVLA